MGLRRGGVTTDAAARARYASRTHRPCRRAARGVKSALASVSNRMIMLSRLNPYLATGRISALQRVFLSLPYSSSGGKSAFERTGSWDRQRCHLPAALGTAGALHAIDAAGSNTWSHPPLSLLRIGSAGAAAAPLGKQCLRQTHRLARLRRHRRER